jgi:hypothetical protein
LSFVPLRSNIVFAIEYFTQNAVHRNTS